MNVQQDLLYKDLSYILRGCFFKIYNTLGFGHKEIIYQQSLISELKSQHIPFETEKVLPITYNNTIVGVYRPDFIIDNKIIIELKAQDFIARANEEQLVHYLKSTGYQLGFLVNFGSTKLEISRKIWSTNYQSNIRVNPL
jgi:GxxExxY protein